MKIYFLASILILSAGLKAEVLSTGEYYSSGGPHIFYNDGNKDAKFITDRVDILVEKKEDAYGVKMLRGHQSLFSFSKNSNSLVNSLVMAKIKANNLNNPLVQSIKSISINNLKEEDSSLVITLNFNIQIDSVFGVGSATLSSDVKIENSNECYSSYWGSAGEERTPMQCIKMTSFLNSRLTQLKTPFEGSYSNMIGFAADVAVKIMLSGLNDVQYLIKL